MPAVSSARQMDFVRWATRMNDAERELLRRVLHAFHLHGATYRRHLPVNQPWLQKAALRMKLAPWLRPKTERAVVDGLHATIAVAAEASSLVEEPLPAG